MEPNYNMSSSAHFYPGMYASYSVLDSPHKSFSGDLFIVLGFLVAVDALREDSKAFQ